MVEVMTMKEKLYNLYAGIFKIRYFEETIIREYPDQLIRTPVHLYIGQEAIATGVIHNLNTTDFIVSNHRSHGHCIAKGISTAKLYKELYGKIGGITNARGGSMHIVDMSNGIIGTSAIVAGGIPIGAGVALKQKIKGEKNITVIFFGDGAVDEGVFWETVNFAKLKELPVLFVMEDNLYASQTHKRERHGYRDITRIIDGFDIPWETTDGNDVIKVDSSSNRLINDIRQSGGPAFFHCQTYRWKGHVGIEEEIGIDYRTQEEISEWKNKCPLQRLKGHLINEYDDAEMIIDAIETQTIRDLEKDLFEAKEAYYALD
jgi:pyruvate dehydrogenase E1 component alpha subunit